MSDNSAQEPVKISDNYDKDSKVIFYHGDVSDLLKDIPKESVQLIITSPPYNIGKEYEDVKSLEKYKEGQKKIIEQCIKILHPKGSICWEVGNYVRNGEIIPLDYIFHDIFSQYNLHLRNRIVWRFGHGLHSSNRFSGRYETILWYTKSESDYIFNLDPVRVPQKYPNKKHYKGKNKGVKSCNPLGKNPSDVWDIPNVKSNHVEKTSHPCQFPIELVERLILSMSNEGDVVFDPFAGVGSTNVAAIKRNRKSIGAEKEKKYVEIAKDRIKKMSTGKLRTRPMNKPIYKPKTDKEYIKKFIGGILD
jgi:adenine-specific DNA-methyltransferase